MESVHSHPANVVIIDQAFPIPQLGRTRRIWLYMPTGYDEHPDKRYPVIYMHDGQNLFDEATAFGEEWGVGETLNALLAECIIVGIDNGEQRITEYNFHDHEQHGAGEGRQYMAFIVETLKPYIDAHYRTIASREHTHIAGSSMGGLISLYGALHFAETFGSVGVFSPSLWMVADKLEALHDVAAQHAHLPQRLFLYGGARESGSMLTHIHRLAALLERHTHHKVLVMINPNGDHSEYAWRNMFPHYYEWLSAGTTSVPFDEDLAVAYL